MMSNEMRCGDYRQKFIRFAIHDHSIVGWNQTLYRIREANISSGELFTPRQWRRLRRRLVRRR
ncbi:hypothetical protein KBD61_04175 [Patescibacteria group bacterium]|nr:hypothetical protein [Patescibacteria group bacterium]MBP9710193.1 hypothetical protein [Patescibacteria group bacterium]